MKFVTQAGTQFILVWNHQSIFINQQIVVYYISVNISNGQLFLIKKG
jgi:hypothetical protein